MQPWRLRVDNHIERKACRWSKGARSQAHWRFERSFPLPPHPAHSLGEGESFAAAWRIECAESCGRLGLASWSARCQRERRPS